NKADQTSVAAISRADRTFSPFLYAEMKPECPFSGSKCTVMDFLSGTGHSSEERTSRPFFDALQSVHFDGEGEYTIRTRSISAIAFRVVKVSEMIASTSGAFVTFRTNPAIR